MAQAVQPAGPSTGRLQAPRASVASREVLVVQVVQPVGPSAGRPQGPRAWAASREARVAQVVLPFRHFPGGGLAPKTGALPETIKRAITGLAKAAADMTTQHFDLLVRLSARPSRVR